MKTCLNRILVVEGKEDAAYLSNFYNSEIVAVNGFEMNSKTIDYLKNKPLILLLDPDEAGKQIRQKLHSLLNDYVDVEIDISKCNRGSKNGVAECETNEILLKLEPYVCSKPVFNAVIQLSDLYNLGLSNDKELRMAVCDKLNLGKCNLKTFYKRLVNNNIDCAKLKTTIERIKHGN